MRQLLEINFISPISDYAFDTANKKYYLVIINNMFDTLIINKIALPNINNITERIRAYYINKSILLEPNQGELSINLIEHDDKTNILKLIACGYINTDKSTFGNIEHTTLYFPSKVANKERNILYVNEQSYTREEFNNFETYQMDNKCILFFTKMMNANANANTESIKPYMFKFDMVDDSKYIYNRYCKHAMLEMPLNIININDYCANGKSYTDFIGKAQIDINRYNKYDDKLQFKGLFSRKINKDFRPLKYEKYKNNVIFSPTDSRTIGFNTSKDTVLRVNGVNYNIRNMVSKPYEIINGSGFMSRLHYADYPRIHIPYSANLKEIGIHNFNNNQYCINMRFESNYYMPPQVHEREYISVIYGNNVQMSRIYPELVDIQSDTKLIYHMLLFGNNKNDSVIFTNNKIIGMLDDIKMDTTIRLKSIWMKEGEEIGTFNCCLGKIVCLFNRPINFATDIRYFSLLDNNKPIKKIECLIRAKDVIGMLE